MRNTTEDPSSAADGGVEGVLGGFLAGQRRLEFLRPDVADLHQIAEAQATYERALAALEDLL